MFYFKIKNPSLFLLHKFFHSLSSPSHTTETTAAPKSNKEKIYKTTKSDPEYACGLKTLQKLQQLYRLNSYESEFILTK